MERQSVPDQTAQEQLLERGNQALERGAWAESRELFERSIQVAETPEALEGLGRALSWQDEVIRLGEVRERAYRTYRERGDARGAARVALALAEDAMLFRGAEAVRSGWTERARRLLADLEASPEHALLALRDAFFAFMLSGDMEAARGHAGQAIELAKQFEILDLEMLARAIDGVARVAEGDVAEGMRILDEATAAATSGEMRDVELIGDTCCFMIYGCERVRDFPRAAQWCERVQEFSERNGLTSLLGVCRIHYATVLALAGNWSSAEAELMGAAEQLKARPAQASEGVARLGELRRRQGRHEEAVSLFEQVAFLPEAQVGRALLALDQDDYAGALGWAERLLRQVAQSDRMQRVHGYEVLARARASLGDIEGARDALRQVESAAKDIGTPLMRAAAAMSAGAIETAAGNAEGARALLEDAIDLFERSQTPYEAAEARMFLARVLYSLGEHLHAQNESTRAADSFARLGAVHAEERARAALPSSIKSKAEGILTPRELEILSLVADGCSDKAIAERLTISEHTVHRHISNILTKLKVSSRAAAAAQAAKLGIF